MKIENLPTRSPEQNDILDMYLARISELHVGNSTREALYRLKRERDAKKAELEATEQALASLSIDEVDESEQKQDSDSGSGSDLTWFPEP